MTRQTIPATARLAERTVVDADRHATGYRRPARRPRPVPPAPVQVEQIDPDVWQQQILPLAGGDPARIEIVDAATVIVHNSATWRPGRGRRNGVGQQP